MSQHETTRQESVTENNQKPADTSSQNGRSTKSASAVGTKFVLKYYTILSTSPHSVHNFYAENSTFTFGEYSSGGRTLEESVKGQEQIRKKIQQLDFKDCKVTLDVVNCQDSLQDSVFILVIGYVHKEQVQPRKFTQCFVLAAQSESETSKRYHIVNDMFHYLEETSTSSTAPAASASNSTPSAPPTNTSSLPTSRSESTPNGDSASAPKNNIQSNKKDEATAKAPPVQTEQPSDLNNQVSHAPSAPTTPSTPPAAAPSTPSAPSAATAAPSSTAAPAEKHNNTAHADSKKLPKREKANKEANNANNAAASKQSNAKVTAPSEAQPTAEKVDKSWAQIAKSKSAPTAPPAAAAAPQQQQVQSPQPQQQSQQQNEQKLSKSASSSPYESREVRDGYSVYVSNLPFNATDESVRGLFSPFGEIKSVVILKGYCFVEFVSPESVKHIVQSSKETPLVLDGRALSIDWKKGKSGSKSPKNQEKSNSFNRSHPRNKDMKRSGTSPAVNGKFNKQHEHNEKKAALSKDG